MSLSAKIKFFQVGSILRQSAEPARFVWLSKTLPVISEHRSNQRYNLLPVKINYSPEVGWQQPLLTGLN